MHSTCYPYSPAVLQRGYTSGHVKDLRHDFGQYGVRDGFVFCTIASPFVSGLVESSRNGQAVREDVVCNHRDVLGSDHLSRRITVRDSSFVALPNKREYACVCVVCVCIYTSVLFRLRKTLTTVPLSQIPVRFSLHVASLHQGVPLVVPIQVKKFKPVPHTHKSNQSHAQSKRFASQQKKAQTPLQSY